MKVFKPDTLALLYRTLQLENKNILSLGIMAMFHYDCYGPEGLSSEAQLWGMASQALEKNEILDVGFPKPGSEFFVYGACYAGASVKQSSVIAQVGNTKKILLVNGERCFNVAGKISEAQPFTVMPIGRAQAFGGNGFLDNPSGKGSSPVTQKDGSTAHFLPNIELPHMPMLYATDRPKPAGFWSIPHDSAQRRQCLGNFDQRWLSQQWPHFPDDTQPAYFYAAATDQRIPGFLQGDEKIELIRMHPQRPMIVTTLPKLRARCFVHRCNQEFSELDTRLESVWLFPEHECGIVLYRASTTLIDSDAEDILHVMAEWELLTSAPLPFKHYQAYFERQVSGVVEVPPFEHTELAPSAPPVPPVASVPTAAIMPAAIAAGGEESFSAELKELETMLGNMTSQVEAGMQQHGLTQADLQTYLVAPSESLQSGEDVEIVADRMEKEIQALMQKHGFTETDIKNYLPTEAPEPSLEQLQQQLQAMEKQTDQIMQEHKIGQSEIQKFISPELGKMMASIDPSTEEIFAGLAMAPMVASEQKENIPTAKNAAVLAPSLRLTRERILEKYAKKQNFTHADLSGIDLSHLDLSGINLCDAILEKTNFFGSNLDAARFDRALMLGADFSHANLRQASMSYASASAALFVEANLEASDMRCTDFSGADFSMANLCNTNITQAIFDGARMVEIQASFSSATQASFAQCDLTAANFSQAKLEAASFNQAKLRTANLTQSYCAKAEFYGADASKSCFKGSNLQNSRADNRSNFNQAIFSSASLHRASWGGAMLRDANFENAQLDNADFSKVQASGSCFERASAQFAKFGGADLSQANLDQINLFKGSLRKAKVKGATMRLANLYGVDFDETAPLLASLEGSNLTQTILQFRFGLVNKKV